MLLLCSDSKGTFSSKMKIHFACTYTYSKNEQIKEIKNLDEGRGQTEIQFGSTNQSGESHFTRPGSYSGNLIIF